MAERSGWAVIAGLGRSESTERLAKSCDIQREDGILSVVSRPLKLDACGRRWPGLETDCRHVTLGLLDLPEDRAVPAGRVEMPDGRHRTDVTAQIHPLHPDKVNSE
jgi:hypothetical protein